MRPRWLSSGDGRPTCTRRAAAKRRTAVAELLGSRGMRRSRRGRRLAKPLQGQGRPGARPASKRGRRGGCGHSDPGEIDADRTSPAAAAGDARLPAYPSRHLTTARTWQGGRASPDERPLQAESRRRSPARRRLRCCVRHEGRDQRIRRSEPASTQCRWDDGLDRLQLLAGIHAEVDLGRAHVRMSEP